MKDMMKTIIRQKMNGVYSWVRCMSTRMCVYEGQREKQEENWRKVISCIHSQRRSESRKKSFRGDDFEEKKKKWGKNDEKFKEQYSICTNEWIIMYKKEENQVRCVCTYCRRKQMLVLLLWSWSWWSVIQCHDQVLKRLVACVRFLLNILID